MGVLVLVANRGFGFIQFEYVLTAQGSSDLNNWITGVDDLDMARLCHRFSSSSQFKQENSVCARRCDAASLRPGCSIRLPDPTAPAPLSLVREGSGQSQLPGCLLRRFLSEACRLSSTRRLFDAKGIRVGTRGATFSERASSCCFICSVASMRLRHCDLFEDTDTLRESEPAFIWTRSTSRTGPRRCSNLQIRITLVSEVLTCCPPGPPDRANFHSRSSAETCNPLSSSIANVIVSLPD